MQKKGNISKTDAKRTLELTLNSIKEALSKSDVITLIGFGSIKNSRTLYTYGS